MGAYTYHIHVIKIHEPRNTKKIISLVWRPLLSSKLSFLNKCVCKCNLTFQEIHPFNSELMSSTVTIGNINLSFQQSNPCISSDHWWCWITLQIDVMVHWTTAILLLAFGQVQVQPSLFDALSSYLTQKDQLLHWAYYHLKSSCDIFLVL